jgi:hypothetical protein
VHLRPNNVVGGCTFPILLLVLSTLFPAGKALAGYTIEVVNGTRTVMVSLQVKETNAPAWHFNALRDGPLGVQKRTTIGVPDACVCDLKATFEDGHRVTRPRVNLCRTSTYVVRDF